MNLVINLSRICFIFLKKGFFLLLFNLIENLKMHISKNFPLLLFK